MASVDQITPLHVKERKTCAPNNTRVLATGKSTSIARARSPRGRNASRAKNYSDSSVETKRKFG
jgi:hypothetical protein